MSNTPEEISNEKTMKKKCKDTKVAEYIEIMYKLITFLVIKPTQNVGSISTEDLHSKSTCSKIFSFVFHAIISVGNLRFIVPFFMEPARLKGNELFLVMVMYVIFISFSFFYRLFSAKNFTKMYQRLLEIEHHFEDKYLCLNPRKFKILFMFQIMSVPVLYIATVLIWIDTSGKGSFLVFMFTYPIPVDKNTYFPVSLISLIFICIGTTWSHILSSITYYFIDFLQCQFDGLAKSFRKDVLQAKNDFKYNLSSLIFDLCDAYDELCNLLDSVNSFCHIFMGFMCACTIAQICLLTFQLIHNDLKTIEAVLFITVILQAIALCLYIRKSIQLKISAHQLTDDLYAIDLRNLSAEASLKVSIFLTRLTSSPIGISVAGLFVIDHSTILMLTGTLLTYIIVVIQTKSPECSCQNNFNSTLV